MANRFAAVGCSGLVICVICLAAAAAIGGRQFANGLDFRMFNGKPECEAVPGAAASRDLDWDGSDHFGLDVPAEAQYSTTNGPKLHVTGDPQVVAHLVIRNSAVQMNCNTGFGLWGHDGSLQITVPGRQFNKFSIAGSGKLLLQNLDQPMLTVSIAGSGSIKANGKVEHTVIHIAGSGDADLGAVVTKVAEIHVAGSGDTDIAPTDEADIHIAGSGDVTLHAHPKRLDQHIAGSGSVRILGYGG